MVQRRGWFWALIVTLLCVLAGSVSISTCLFMDAPQITRPEPIAVVESQESGLPHVPQQSGLDFIGERLPADIQWVLEIQNLRALGLQMADEDISFDMSSVRGPWSGLMAEVFDSVPFNVQDPLDWIRSGYDLTRPWGIAWHRENREDSGAWLLFVPVRSAMVAEDTTRAWLHAWDESDGRVAWVPGADYQQIAIEVADTRSPNARLQLVSDAISVRSLAGVPQGQTLVQALGGAWTVRLRFRNSGAGEIHRILEENQAAAAWPIMNIDPGAHMGLALRLQRNHQRLRIGLVGPHLAQVRVEAGLDVDPNQHQILNLERLPTVLSIRSVWWDSLKTAGLDVDTSLEDFEVTAEMGPQGLVVDLRRSGTVDALEPVIEWWSNRL